MKKIIDSNNFIFWFVLAFVIKLALLYLFLLNNPTHDFFHFKIASNAGDTFSYLEPMENYIQKNEYYAERNNIKYYAVRPPHYMFLYYLLYKLNVSKDSIFDFMALIQLILNALSVVLLSKLASQIFEKKNIFYISFAFLSFSSSISYLNNLIFPESIVISMLSIGIYLYYQYSKTKKNLYLVSCGVLFALSVQLRPYIILVLLLPLFYLLINFFRDKNIRNLITPFLLYSLAIIIVLSPWAIRNYKIYHVFAPYDYKILDFYNGKDFINSTDYTKRKLLNALGYSDIYWDVKNMASYFEDSTSEFKKESLFRFSKYDFTKDISIREFETARKLCLESRDSVFDEKDIKAKVFLLDLINKYKSEKPFNYYIISPLLIIKNSIFHLGTYFIPFRFNEINNNILLKLWKILELIMYQCLLLFSAFGFVISVYKRNIMVLLGTIPISVIITVMSMQHGEYRYFALSYPVLFIFASFGLHIFFETTIRLISKWEK